MTSGNGAHTVKKDAETWSRTLMTVFQLWNSAVLETRDLLQTRVKSPGFSLYTPPFLFIRFEKIFFFSHFDAFGFLHIHLSQCGFLRLIIL